MHPASTIFFASGSHLAVTQQAFNIEIDLRGETLICSEGNRRATIICTFGGDPCLVPRTLSGWWYPDERREEAMSEDEAAVLVARIADYCRNRFGMSRLRIEDA
jgi:hypothetical protein